MKHLIFFLLFTTTQLLIADENNSSIPKTAALWTVSSQAYPEYNISQVEYTKQLRHLTQAEFWIDKLEHPHRLLLSTDEIERLNTQTAQKELIFPAKDFKRTYEGRWVEDKIMELYTFLYEGAYFHEDGSVLQPNFMQEILTYMNIAEIPSHVTTRYAITVDYTLQRVTPTDITILKRPEQIYFDRNQNAALDIGTPLALVYQTKDKKWYFAISESSYGWVKSEDIALATRQEMLNFAYSENFIITINPKNSIYLHDKYYNFVRMGVRLPHKTTHESREEIVIPRRDADGKLRLHTATIKRSDVHIGYMSYTQKNIIEQAFKSLNAPYGWGGMFGEQDCSKFIQTIYATMGIILPRNSGDQSKVGDYTIKFQSNHQERVQTLVTQAKPAQTLLYLPGHITLYLGTHQNIPYMIHAVWGERNGKNPMAKTAVTSVYFKKYLDTMYSMLILSKFKGK